MPFIDKKNPFIPGRPEPFKKLDIKIPQNPIKKAPAETASHFSGRSPISKAEINRYFKKNTQVRGYLKREFGLKTQNEVEEEVSKLKQRVTENFGRFIEWPKFKKAMRDEYWNAKHQAEKNPKDWRSVNKRKKEDEFLKKQFGIK